MSDSFQERMAALTRGGELAVPGEYLPVFMVKPGRYPATIVEIVGPWPRKPSKYYPKGDMRLTFRLKLDGIEGLLKEAGIEAPPPERASWYQLGINFHYPTLDTQPPTFIGDEAQAWTKSDSEIGKYYKPWTKTAAFQGVQTIYGGFMEAGAIGLTKDNEEFIDFAEVVGARVFAMVKPFENDPTKSFVASIMGLTAPRATRLELDRDPSLNKLTQDQCLHLRDWPRPKDGEPAGSGMLGATPSPSKIQWFSSVVRVHEPNIPLMDSIKGMVQRAAQASGAAESRFSCLLGEDIHIAVLQDIAQLLGEHMIDLPALPNEPWASSVAARHIRAANPAGASESGSLV